MQFGMNRNKQKKDAMLFVMIGYVALAGIIIGAAIGRLL